MGLLFGSRSLPTTTYGYQPPPDATAHGWQCNNEDCGTGDSPAPRRWPARCTRCGGPADPDFDQPWHEEARGLRLQMLASREPTEVDAYTGGIREWSYGRALSRGDLAAAEAIRQELHQWMDRRSAESNYFQPSTNRSMVVHHAIVHGQIDAAADELTSWFAVADVFARDYARLGDSSSEGNSLRVDSFTLLRSAIGFLENPRARSHPLAPAIDKATRYLGGATQHEMALDLRYRWQALMKTPEPGH